MVQFELSGAQQYRLLLLFIRADTSKEGRLSMQVFDELCFFVVSSRCAPERRPDRARIAVGRAGR
jgi:hypothetical protein